MDSKLYKPTGPDGKGWGDFRVINENDLALLNELEDKDQLKKERISLKQQNKQNTSKVVPINIDSKDKDERWEQLFQRKM